LGLLGFFGALGLSGLLAPGGFGPFGLFGGLFGLLGSLGLGLPGCCEPCMGAVISSVAPTHDGTTNAPIEINRTEHRTLRKVIVSSFHFNIESDVHVGCSQRDRHSFRIIVVMILDSVEENRHAHSRCACTHYPRRGWKVFYTYARFSLRNRSDPSCFLSYYNYSA
jgi:hypothetical protein